MANCFYTQRRTGEVVNNKLIAVLIALLFVFSLVPLSSHSTKVSHVTAASASNTLVIGTTSQVPAPTDLNPIRMIVTYYIAETYASLIGWDSFGNLVPELAQNWTVSSDGLTYTYNLKPGLEWSDGQPLNASDVAFTANLVATQSPLWSYIYTPIEQANSSTLTGESLVPGSMTVTNATQIVFHLPSPSATFLIYAGGQPIYPEHYYEGYNLTANNPDYSTMVGSGAFIPTAYTPGVEIDMTANPHYFGGAPHLSSVIFKFFSDTTSAEIALEGGSVNYLQGVPPPDVSSIAKTPGILVGTEEDQSNIYMVFNMNPELNNSQVNPVSNILVRQAIAYALNMSEILNDSFGGSQYYRLANQIEVPNMYYGGQPIQNTTIPNPEYPQNVTLAKQLLAEANYSSGFTINVIFPSTGIASAGSGVTLKMMQLMASQLSAVGITLTLDSVDQTDFDNIVYNAAPPKTWNLALSVISESPDGDVAPYYMVSSLNGNAGTGGFDSGSYNSTTLNQLVLQEENTTNPAQRIAIFQKIDGYIHQQLPVLEIYYELQIVAWSNQYTGFELGLGNPWHDYFGSLKMQSLANVSVVGSSTASTTSSVPATTTGTGNSSTSMVSSMSSTTSSSIMSNSTTTALTSSSTGSSVVVPSTTAVSSSSTSSSSSSTLEIVGAIVVVIIIVAAAAAFMMRRGRTPAKTT